MKVLVCDDRQRECEDAVREINGLQIPELQVELLYFEELREVLEGFFQGIGIDDDDSQAPVQSKFDDYDIVFLDNNLSALGIRGARLTAEAIAGYIRAYSSSTYIVSLNKNPGVDFDLGFLIGDYSTVTDLALNTEHLANKALWTGDINDTVDGFKPWYWPALSKEHKRRKKQISFVGENLEASVFSALGFPSEVARYISRHATETLSLNADYLATSLDTSASVEQITFGDFFLARNRSIQNREDREKLLTLAQSSDPTAQACKEMVCRLVAADIDLWIRRDLIAPQDALVDIPHLLVRMPFLCGSQASNPEKWQETLAISTSPFGLDPELYQKYLEPNRLKHDMWAIAPTFWWPLLKTNEDLNNLFFTSEGDWAEVVFCEDTSSFLDQQPADQKPLSEFEAEFEGAWRRRYVKTIPNYGYFPRSRFAI